MYATAGRNPQYQKMTRGEWAGFCCDGRYAFGLRRLAAEGLNSIFASDGSRRYDGAILLLTVAGLDAGRSALIDQHGHDPDRITCYLLEEFST